MSDFSEALDLVDQANDLIEAIVMAVDELNEDRQRNAIWRVCQAAQNALGDARDILNERIEKERPAELARLLAGTEAG